MRSSRAWGLACREKGWEEGRKEHAGKMLSDLRMRKEAVLSEPLGRGDGAQAGDILFPTIAPPLRRLLLPSSLPQSDPITIPY